MNISSILTRYSKISLVLGIVLIFFAIILIGYIAIQNQQQKFEHEIQSELTTIANLKATSIEDWYHERKSDAEVAMKNTMIFDYLINLQNPGSSDISTSDVRAWMQSLITSYRYRGIVLLNNTGSIVLSVPDGTTVSLESMNITLPKAQHSSEPVFTDLFIEQETGNKSMEFWVPIQKKTGEPLEGFLILQINPNEYLYPMIQSWPTSSRTAESLITRLNGNEVLFLNELRHISNASLIYSIPLTQENVPAVMAAQGYRGIVKGDDYRGVPVIASINNITDTPWYIVAKIDQEEIYSPFTQFTQLVIGVIILLSGVAGLGFLLIWKARENEFLNIELEQKQHELYLAERMHLLMQQANDAILILDNDWHIIEVNDRAVEMYGFTSEELRTKKLFDLRSESARLKIDEDMERLGNSQGIIYSTEYQKKDRTVFPVEDSIRMVNILGTLYRQVIIRDITERKAYEKELLEKNEKLQLMNEEISTSYEELASQQEELRDQMETIHQSEIELHKMHNRLTEAQKAGHVGVWEYYLRSESIWGTDEAFRIYGLTPAPEMIVDISKILECIPNHEQVLLAIHEVVERGIPLNTEFTIHPADGSPDRIISSIGELYHDEDGNPLKIVGVVLDITEKRMYEADIQKYQEKLSALFKAPILGILFGDIYGFISQANDEFLRIIGYTRDEFNAGKIKSTDITPPEFYPRDVKGIAIARQTGRCNPYEKQYIRKDGSLIWVLVGYVLVEPAREESVAFILDISNAKKNEEEIRIINQTLEKRVIERTNQLTFINEELQTEVEERLQAENKLQETLSTLSATIESTEDGILVVNASGEVSLYNKMFLHMWDIPDSLKMLKCEDNILQELAKKIINTDLFSEQIKKIKTKPDLETFNTLKLSDNRIFEQYSKPQRIGDKIVGRVWSFRDVTKRKEMENQIEKSLHEKEILLKEIHHRVKNNMQVVSSLLYIQSRLATDKNLKEILLESQNRVKSIALVHEELYQSRDLDRIDYIRYLHKIARNIFDTYKADTNRISLHLSESTVFLTISKAVPCSLIMNELISNSLKHAFPDGRKGIISIVFLLEKGKYHLKYEDNGVGISGSVSAEKPKTLGLELINGLVKQLSGKITVDMSEGTRYDIEFPE